jgi:hypothetical protein
MPNLTLTTTPGLTATTTTRLDAAALNAIANPLVELVPTGAITPDYLNLPSLINAVGDPTRNYLRRGNFNYEDWAAVEATTAAGTTSTVTAEWWCKAAGGPVTVRRVIDAPTIRSTWSAELQAGAGVTSASFYTWVPPSIGGGFRSGDITFSVWVKNQTLSNIFVTPYMEIASNTNERLTLQAAVSGTTITVPSNGWTRLSLTVNAAAYDLSKGAGFGVVTTSLSATGAAMRVAQAQLEPASAATTFARPAAPVASLSLLSRLTDAERVLGAELVVQLTNGELRLFPNPPTSIFAPVLGFDRTCGIPVWIDSKGFIEVYQYTGQDQLLTVPAGITSMKVYCWGAGGSIKDDKPGGVGGFAYATFPVSVGNTFTVMVGGAGGTSTAGAYGFGGAGDIYGSFSLGGGLSGLFSGITTVLETDAARALLIAGGGGAVDSYHNVAGGNGGDTDTNWGGGQSTMRGFPGTSAVSNSGGGGYAGGGDGAYYAAKGGSSFLRTSGTYPTTGSTSGGLQFTARTTPVLAGQQLTVPGSTNAKYQSQAGQSGRNGLIVVEWIL